MRVWALQPHIQVVPLSRGPLATSTDPCEPGTPGRADQRFGGDKRHGHFAIIEATDGVFYRLKSGPPGWRELERLFMRSMSVDGRGWDGYDASELLGLPPEASANTSDRVQEIIVSGVALVATDKSELN